MRAVLFLACLAGASALAQSQGVVTTSLTVKGSVERETTLSVDDLKPLPEQRMDFRKSAVIATASDGYRVVFSWSELYLSPIGDGALVVYERDGAPLDDSEGRIAPVSLKDTRPGPRHVKWLQSLELRVLE